MKNAIYLLTGGIALALFAAAPARAAGLLILLPALPMTGQKSKTSPEL